MDSPVIPLDVEVLRRQAREHVEGGAVTAGYSADRDVVVDMLGDALATELVCMLRYRRHHFMANGIHAPDLARESAVWADLIKTQKELESVIAALSRSEFVTVDTEFMRERTYWPQLCLVQIATESDCYLVDPLAGLDLDEGRRGALGGVEPGHAQHALGRGLRQSRLELRCRARLARGDGGHGRTAGCRCRRSALVVPGRTPAGSRRDHVARRLGVELRSAG